MTAVTVMSNDHEWMPRDHEWTVEDLESLPEDGLQYELFDGVLIVSPSPIPVHQRALQAIYRLLFADCPPELEVFVAPLDFQPTPIRSMQPDVLVVRRADLGRKKLAGTPLLAVEVLSASTRSKDLVIKRLVYRDAGVASFWVFDPGDPDKSREPHLTAYDLRDGGYHQVAAGAGQDLVAVDRPYPVTVCPADLVAG